MTIETTSAATRFALPSRILHWLMAPMVIAQLLIGVTMVASLSYYPLLLAIHRPLGVLILIFAVMRLANRLTHKLPRFPATMGPAERKIASWSEYLLYALLLIQPLTGWAMLSAARSPIVSAGAVSAARHRTARHRCLCGCCRQAHSVFAFLLFAVFTAHVCAVLFHTLVLRDRLLDRMALWPTGPTGPTATQPDETKV